MNIKRSLIYTVPVLASFAALTAAVWGRGKAEQAARYERIADEYVCATVNSCSRCAQELSDSVNELSVSLSKLRVISGREGRILALEDIVRESSEASAYLSRLPRSQVETMELAGFLTRAGDYARTLSRKLLFGGELDPEDFSQLEKELGSCAALDAELTRRIASGEMPVGTEEFDYYDIGGDAADEPSEPEYPVLIYDGPFSESTEKLVPLGVTGEEADEQAALARARELFGGDVRFDGMTSGRIPTYDFTDGRGGSIALTVRGLHVLSYMAEPSGSAEGVPDDAEYQKLLRAARAFLEKLGYSGMTPTYAQFCGGEALFSFVWESGGVLVYNDLVKAAVDRETLEPCGLDAQNWLFSHRERHIPAPAIDEAQARLSVHEGLRVASCRLALIPLSPQTEALCWEVRGTLEDSEYIVCINAQNAREEQVFIVISDENGQSTV